MKASKMLNMRANNLTSSTSPADFEAIGTKSFADMELLPVLRLRSTKTFNSIKYEANSFKNYFKAVYSS